MSARVNEVQSGKQTYGANVGQISSAVKFSRSIYRFLALLFVACITLQVYFAGLGLLVDSGFWSYHIIFGERIAFFVPLAMILSAFASRYPGRFIFITFLLFFLYYLQWVFLYAPIHIGGEQLLRALHPVNALAMFGLTLFLLQRTRSLG